MDATRLIRRPAVLAALIGGAALQPAIAQEMPHTLLQLEVRDSIGLPLPDATVEVYALMDRAVFREWVLIDPAALPPGIHLLRFSHPGYRSAVFSVPLAEGDPVSLRVRLHPGDDSKPRQPRNQAARVDAIGLEVDGRGEPDIIGGRRVIDRSSIEWASRGSIRELLRAVSGTRVSVHPASGSASTARVSPTAGSGWRCRTPVVVNGERRGLQSFALLDQFSRPDDIEVLEIFPPDRWVPPRYRPFGSNCGLIVAWVRRH